MKNFNLSLFFINFFNKIPVFIVPTPSGQLQRNAQKPQKRKKILYLPPSKSALSLVLHSKLAQAAFDLLKPYIKRNYSIKCTKKSRKY